MKENQTKLNTILETYHKGLALPDALTVVIAIPLIEDSNNELDKFCINAMQQLCPSAEIRVDEYDFEEWGVVELELGLADHHFEESKMESEAEMLESTLRQFYHDVAVIFFEDEVEFREKRRRDRRRNDVSQNEGISFEEKLEEAEKLFLSADESMRSLLTSLRDLSLLSLGTEKEKRVKAFRDKIWGLNEWLSWPDELFRD
ncbi:MAG: hypothetical protein GVY36_17135 [Verrucomicrobia bacterium]|jgi:hypothetical protein|nr:hypothetical protein [Verrucomicrobiota bacterium]